MKTSERRIRDMWLWEPGLLRLTVGVLILTPVLLACASYPFLRSRAWVICLFAGIGALAWVVYTAVGNKVERLRHLFSADVGEVVDSLIVNGNIQSPGIAVLRDRELVLVPIVGKQIALPFSDIKCLRETRWFNGVYYGWKTGFWLTPPGEKRLGFAVASPVAAEWRDILSPARGTRTPAQP